MLRSIVVEPLGDGWRVRADGLDNDLLFRSGRQAEISARRLGERLAEAGEPAEVRIHLRDGSLAARFACPPPWSLERPWQAQDVLSPDHLQAA